MANTIAGYTTFVALTQAKSAQVNENFSNHRGDLAPINTDTATASDNTHDLGVSTYRYKDSYVAGAMYLGNANTTGGWRIQIGTTTTTLSFEYYSSTAYVIKGEYLA